MDTLGGGAPRVYLGGQTAPMGSILDGGDGSHAVVKVDG